MGDTRAGRRLRRGKNEKLNDTGTDREQLTFYDRTKSTFNQCCCNRTHYIPTAPLSICGSRENYRLIGRISVTSHMGQPDTITRPGMPRYGWRLQCDRWLLTSRTSAQTAAAGLGGNEWEREGERGLRRV